MTEIPNLNRAQRLSLAAIGCVILIIQLYKFSRDGIEGASWILAFVAVGVFWLPFLSAVEFPSYKWHSKSRRAQVTPEMQRFVDIHDAQKQNEKTLAAIRNQAALLWKQLPAWVSLPDIESLRVINSLVTDHWLEHCHSYLFALAWAAEVKKDRHFIASERENLLTARVARYMAETAKENAYRHQLTSGLEPQNDGAWAVRELVEARAVARAFIDALANGTKPPDAVLLDYFSTKLGVPSAQRISFDMHLRNFTKESLSILSS